MMGKGKNFLRNNWIKIVLIVWLLYGILKLNSILFKGTLFEVVLWIVIAFAAGYDFGKKH
ncbi:MAG: hypothetical protein HZB36_05105 [Candidatus Omnitrophica bacterium]|nr:hypothetical protein [Candidatus Omnitrophota bacterium]